MVPSAGGVFLGVVKRRNSIIIEATSPASYASTDAKLVPKILVNGTLADYAMASYLTVPYPWLGRGWETTIESLSLWGRQLQGGQDELGHDHDCVAWGQRETVPIGWPYTPLRCGPASADRHPGCYLKGGCLAARVANMNA